MNLFLLVPEVTEKHTALPHLPSWIRKIAEKVNYLTVFTLNYDENIDLPSNVKVLCPPKNNKFQYFFFINYYLLIGVLNSKAVLCLMYPILTIWVSYYTKIFRTPIVTWYCHGSVSEKLKEACKKATLLITCSKLSFRLKTDKLRIIGHGIDTDKFVPVKKMKNNNIKIMYIGRITESKGIDCIINAANILINQEKMNKLKFQIVGHIPDESHRNYLNELKKMINGYNLQQYFEFTGTIPFQKIENYYQNCDIFVNPSSTGSIDKNVLEAMSCQKMVITSNEAFYEIFDDKMREKCFFKHDDYNDLARKIEISLYNPHENLTVELRRIVVENHNLDLWVDKMINVLNESFSK